MGEAAAKATASATAPASEAELELAVTAVEEATAAAPPLPYPVGIWTPMTVTAWGMHQLEKFWRAALLASSERWAHFQVLLLAASPIQRANCAINSSACIQYSS